MALEPEETSLDYLGPSRPAADAILVTPTDRADAVDFCYRIANINDLDCDAVAMAMNAVDHFLSLPGHVAQDALRDRRKFRFVVVAALSLSVEPHEGHSLTVPGHDIRAGDEVRAMASHIRWALRGRVVAPTSLQIARRILSLALRVNLEESRWGFVLDLVRFQTEDAVRDYFFATQLPSIVAVAAVLNAFDQVTGKDRQTLRGGLLLVLPGIVSKIGCPEDLLAAKERLQHVIEPEDFSDDADARTVSRRMVSPTKNLEQL